MSREIELHCVVIIEGQPWPISIHGYVAEDGQVTKALAQMVKWAKTLGLRPAGSPLDSPPRGAPPGLPHVPSCPVHRTPMKVSKFTDNGYIATYFCPHKNGNEYCKQKANVGEGGVLDRVT